MRKTSRNPPWIRDELILALDLYFKCRQSLPGPKSASVIELSHLLNQMGVMLQRTKDNATYRNPNGVSMKLMNFRRLDPLYINEGKKGLTAGNKEEIVVWDEFAHQPNQLSVVAHAICQAIAASESEKLNIELSEDWEMSEASEGRVLTRMHRIRERNPKLVKQVKNNVLKKYGKLFCFACYFDFAEKYGEAGKGLIDVHHTKPIHTLGEHSKTKIEDLVLLCPNCHRVVHAKRPWLSLDELISLVRQ